ncbi:MAG: type IV pili methyl-accepting chemotaxis transducer N-terminal domain-containing protein, partial [Pseudomonadota bacterium]
MTNSATPALSRRAALGLMSSSAFAMGLGLPNAALADTSLLAQRRIVMAGRQRMLTQRMSRAVMFMALDIEAKRSLSILRRSHETFGTSLAVLRDGDAEQGLPPEDDPSVTQPLAAVDAYWAAFSTQVGQILDAESVTDFNIPIIATLNLSLLEAADDVVKSMVLAYGQKQLDQGLAVAINIAARQRMLTQKIAKEAGLIGLGFEVETNTAQLDETIKLFEASLSALMTGLPTITLPPPPETVLAKLV